MARTNTEGTLAVTSFASLASSTTTGAAGSAARTTDNTTNVIDTQVHVKITVGAITPSATTQIVVWAYGSTDGSAYAGAQTGSVEVLGSDAAVTLSTYGNNLRHLETIKCHTASIAYITEPLSIAQAFGGAVPQKWGIVIQNQTGAALAASGHEVAYNEISFA